jgi:Ala-tRNA(Pro) deacylase
VADGFDIDFARACSHRVAANATPGLDSLAPDQASVATAILGCRKGRPPRPGAQAHLPLYRSKGERMFLAEPLLGNRDRRTFVGLSARWWNPANGPTGKESLMPAQKLKEFLDRNNVKYVSIQHSPAYTAQEVAAMTHISGRDLAKTVIVKIEGKAAMVVLPANRKVVLPDLRDALEAEQIKLATEEEFKSLFPDCEIGAMPPFGNLYDMDVYVAPNLAAEKEIAFNAGTHTEAIKLAYADFERLVKPKLIPFTT